MTIFDLEQQHTYTDAQLVAMKKRLVNEAMSSSDVINVFRNILPAVGNKLSSVSNLLHGVKNDILKTDFGSIKGFLFSKDYTKRLSDAQYFQLARMPIQVPEGFTGNIAEYGELVNDLSENYYRRVPQYLSEYRTYIAAFISDKATKMSLKDYSAFYKTVDKSLDESKKQLGKFTADKYQTKSVGYFGYVVKNIGEVAGVHKSISRTEALCDIKFINAIDIEVKKTADLLDILITQIKDNSVSDVSGAAASNISEGATVMAELVEFCAVLRYKQEGYVHCVNNMLKELDKNIG